MAELFTCCLLPLAARQVNEMQLRNREPRVYSMLRWSWWSWCFLQLLFLTWDFTAPNVSISFYSGTVQIIFVYFWTAVQNLDWLIWYYLRGGILRYTVSHRGSSSSTPRDIHSSTFDKIRRSVNIVTVTCTNPQRHNRVWTSPRCFPNKLAEAVWNTEGSWWWLDIIPVQLGSIASNGLDAPYLTAMQDALVDDSPLNLYIMIYVYTLLAETSNLCSEPLFESRVAWAVFVHVRLANCSSLLSLRAQLKNTTQFWFQHDEHRDVTLEGLGNAVQNLLTTFDLNLTDSTPFESRKDV